MPHLMSTKATMFFVSLHRPTPAEEAAVCATGSRCGGRGHQRGRGVRACVCCRRARHAPPRVSSSLLGSHHGQAGLQLQQRRQLRQRAAAAASRAAGRLVECGPRARQGGGAHGAAGRAAGTCVPCCPLWGRRLSTACHTRASSDRRLRALTHTPRRWATAARPMTTPSGSCCRGASSSCRGRRCSRPRPSSRARPCASQPTCLGCGRRCPCRSCECVLLLMPVAAAAAGSVLPWRANRSTHCLRLGCGAACAWGW